MKETKETLAQRLANRSNGSKTSIYNPFKQDGINLVTLAQEGSLVLAYNENPTDGGPSPHRAIIDKQPGQFAISTLKNILDWEKMSGKAMIGGTIAGFVSNATKRRGKTIRSGILKLN